MLGKFTSVNYVYGKEGTALASSALSDINLTIDDHVFLALVGETGSGKSTLVQHLNGLLLPTSGTVQVSHYLLKTEKKKKYYIDLDKEQGKHPKRKQFKVKDLRKFAGLVFQFPEYQLFEETVLKDVMFGPLNFGMEEKKAEAIAKAALKLVGIGESYYSRSPFELSGGEKRRVAIAGIIALEPKVLVLDEPTAGLDPKGEKEMMELFDKIYQSGKSIILVSHNMDLVLKYAHEVCVMNKGKLLKVSSPLEIFQDEEFLSSTAIEPPLVFKTALELKKAGLDLNLDNIKDIPSLAEEIRKAKKND
ncbi:MAG: energy-coupling factor transporter ATPase [Bacilli bacterium]|nr:energy-coupling factor transporter ATPase [Bacilli bacterium]